jgi:hypothetical protein
MLRITQHFHLANQYSFMKSANLGMKFPPGYLVNQEGGQLQDMLSKLTYVPRLLGEMLPNPLGIHMPLKELASRIWKRYSAEDANTNSEF